MEINKITETIIGGAIEVHRCLGPGLLESTYQECLAREFVLRNLTYEKELSLPVKYKGVALDCGYRLDFRVEKLVIVELKAVETILPVHQAQLLTYMKLTGCNNRSFNQL